MGEQVLTLALQGLIQLCIFIYSCWYSSLQFPYLHCTQGEELGCTQAAFNWILMTRVTTNSEKKIRLQSLRLTFLRRKCSRTCWWVFYPWHQGTRISQNPFMSTLVSNTPECEDTKFYSQQHKIQFHLSRFRSTWNELQLLLSTPQFIRDFPAGPQKIYIERKQVLEGKRNAE